jgi:3-methyladenine DNA glycosylase AlkD
MSVNPRSATPAQRRIAAEIVRALRAAADPAAAKQGHSFFKEPLQLLGVSTPDVRRIARELHGRIRHSWTLPDALALCGTLLPDPRLEVKFAALLVCERFAKAFDAALLPKVHGWIERGFCDSWAIIDCLCSCVLWPLLTRHPELARQARTWTSSRNRWLRRAAAVCLVRPARHGQLLDEAYDVALRLCGDGDDLVQKATGWLLREAGKTDMGRLEAFLRRHGPKIARTTVRYALERFPAEDRRELLEATRSVRPA